MLDLPIENSPQWQLAVDMLNLFVENEVPVVIKPTHWTVSFPGLMISFAEALNRPCLDFPQGKMIMQDRLEKERNDAKNNVEEYVYDMRDKLHGMLEKFVSESVSRRSCFFKGEKWLMCTIWADVTFVYFIWESWLELCVCVCVPCRTEMLYH